MKKNARLIRNKKKLLTTKTYGALHWDKSVYLYTLREQLEIEVAAESAIDEATKALSRQIWSINSMGYESIFQSVTLYLPLCLVCIRNDTWIFNECVNQSKLKRTHTPYVCVQRLSLFLLFISRFSSLLLVLFYFLKSNSEIICTARLYCLFYSSSLIHSFALLTMLLKIYNIDFFFTAFS